MTDLSSSLFNYSRTCFIRNQTFIWCFTARKVREVSHARAYPYKRVVCFVAKLIPGKPVSAVWGDSHTKYGIAYHLNVHNRRFIKKIIFHFNAFKLFFLRRYMHRQGSIFAFFELYITLKYLGNQEIVSRVYLFGIRLVRWRNGALNCEMGSWLTALTLTDWLIDWLTD